MAFPTYFDLPKKFSGYKSAKFVLLPVPLEKTVSYGKGTRLAPKAIFKASHQVELYDEEMDIEPFKSGIAALPPIDCKGHRPKGHRPETKNIETVLMKIEGRVDKILKDRKIPILIGGEHSITPPAVSAVLKHHPSLTVVQLDAHADLREEYGGSKWSHASAMARVREHSPVTGVGIRSLSVEEARRIKKEKLPIFFAHQTRTDKLWIKKAMGTIKTKEVYLTVDVDAFDPSVLPDTGTPEPGGLGWYELTDFIRALSQRRRIVAMDFVELAPRKGQHASDFLVAKLIYKCIGYCVNSRFIGK